MPHSPSVKRDFSKPLLKALDKRGIRIITTTWLPGPNGKYANGERGYVLDDNGTQRIRKVRSPRTPGLCRSSRGAA